MEKSSSRNRRRRLVCGEAQRILGFAAGAKPVDAKNAKKSPNNHVP